MIFQAEDAVISPCSTAVADVMDRIKPLFPMGVNPLFVPERIP